MRVPRGFKGFYAIALLVLTGPLVSAQSSNFDLVRIETDPVTATSASVLQAANGSLYAVGIVNAGTRFQTTPGALRAQTYSPTSPLIFVQKLGSDGSILASALVADATLGVVNAAVDSGGNLYIVAATQSIAGVPNWLSTGVGSGVIKIGPQLDHPNRSWRVDETYIKVAGEWTYLYRAVDSGGVIVEVERRGPVC